MTDAPERIWEFDRYINGVLMAEGVTIEKQPDLPSAMKAAARLASRGLHGEVPVLVFMSDHEAAVEAERERCIKIAVRHWEGEPEDTIAMVDEIRAGEKPLTEYERKVAQMKEDFPNGI